MQVAASEQTNTTQLEFVVEHLGRVEGNLKHGAAKLQLHDGSKRRKGFFTWSQGTYSGNVPNVLLLFGFFSFDVFKE